MAQNAGALQSDLQLQHLYGQAVLQLFRSQPKRGDCFFKRDIVMEGTQILFVAWLWHGASPSSDVTKDKLAKMQVCCQKTDGLQSLYERVFLELAHVKLGSPSPETTFEKLDPVSDSRQLGWLP